MSGAKPDYYKVLEVDSKATSQQIREAYKKAALKHHPDRVPSDSPERARRTRKFQQINDAYYTLSDPTRRRDYDESRRFQPFASTSSGNTNNDVPGGFDFDEEVPHSSEQQQQGSAWNFFQSFPWSTFGFGGASKPSDDSTSSSTSSSQWSSVFEEMMREQGMASEEEGTVKPNNRFWSLVGGISGGAMGFIVANMPGAAAGAVAGNRLGAVRDKRGKSVYTVYQELPQSDRARLLSSLAAKVFAHAVSG